MSLLLSTGGGGQEYSQFLAWLMARPGDYNYNADQAANLYSAYYRITLATSYDTGSMGGSPWGRSYRIYSAISRIVRHCYPSQAMYEEAMAAGRLCRLYVSGNGIDDPVLNQGLDRNGYASPAAYDYGMTSYYFAYWDPDQGMAMTCNPQSMSVPVPLDIGV